MNCEKKETNSKQCACSYDSCPRKGICCLCIRYHRDRQEVPGCLFPPEAEKQYDRSIDHFVRCQKQPL